MRVLRQTVSRTIHTLTAHRKIWLPFILVAVTEAFLIGLLWLAPQPPFSAVLAPPIQFFSGDRVLHYPLHLWFLYHSMRHIHLITSFGVGAFMSGLAYAMVRQIHQGRPMVLRDVLVQREVPYSRMVLAWGVTWAVATGLTELSARLVARHLWGVWVTIGIAVVFQALFIYTIPAAIYDQLIWRKAIMRSLRETLRYPISTVAVIILPMTMIIIFTLRVSSTHVAQWMAQSVPEVAVVCAVARLVLWTIADAVMTVSTAYLWFGHRAFQSTTVTAVSPKSSVRAKSSLRIAKHPVMV